MSLNKKRELTEIAKLICRDLRKNSTEAEKILWNKLRNRKLDDKKFLRQHPIFYDLTVTESFFVADFYCSEEKLIIELDGHYHKYRLKEDEERTEILNMLGLRVIRFSNEDVFNNIDNVLKLIEENCNM